MLAIVPLLCLLTATEAVSSSRRRVPTHDDLTVQTSSGRIHGKIDFATPNVRQFLGVPYARPPLGDLRFAPPVPLGQPRVNIEAKAILPSCLQYFTASPANAFNQDVLEFNLGGLNTTGRISEDCLTLSVWAPTSSSHRPRGTDRHRRGLPVIIFLYGGGFSTGGQDVPYQIPTQWVERTQDHVVLVPNFRSNIFGYPSAPGLLQQNLGTLDIRTVVEWAQTNIAAFGGDPEHMILWGQSSGSMSIDWYTFGFYDDPIVTGVIEDSGTGFTGGFTRPESDTSNFTYVAENVGCAGYGEDSTGLLACMRKVDALVINDFVEKVQRAGQLVFYFVPVVDEELQFANITERALQGKQAKIPAIIGTNLQDGLAFVQPYSADNPDYATGAIYDDLLFFCPATQSTALRDRTGKQTYRFMYAGNFTNVSPRFWLGAYHDSEQPLIFGTHPNYRGNSSQLEYETSAAMQDAWVAFARDGAAGLKAMGWKEHNVGQANIREFGAGVPARDISLAEREAKCLATPAAG
ncbi:hypothetical protein LTR95_000465 [Oleoguttula sp. CCFEE 5521]